MISALKCIAGVRHDIAPGDGVTYAVNGLWEWKAECPRCGTVRIVYFHPDGSWRQFKQPVYIHPDDYRQLLDDNTAHDAKRELLNSTWQK